MNSRSNIKQTKKIVPAPHLSLPPQLFSQAFPFHFVFNRNLELVQAGEILQRLTPLSLVGSQVEQHFRITHPKIPLEFDAIHQRSQSLFLLESLHNGMQLKGQMMYVDTQEVMFFLGSLWVADLEELKPLGVKLKDFAIHDPIVDFLFLLQAKNTAIVDATKLTGKLTQKQAELKNFLKEQEYLKKIADASNRAKSEFLTNMSHELRTPLNGILGYTQILQRSPEITPQQHKGIEVIHTCATHLLTLINDILDICKIEAQKMELSGKDFHLGNFLWELTQMCQLRSQKKGIIFTYQPTTQLPTVVHADDKRLRQVLINLLGNAIKFTDTGSVIFKVSVINYSPFVINKEQRTNNIDGLAASRRVEQITKDKIRFEIQDTGIGIVTEELNKIFEPFEQVGESTHKAEGTGLGLTITKKILEIMGSQLQVKSSLGVGSTFWFEVELPEIAASIDSVPVTSFKEVISSLGNNQQKLEAVSPSLKDIQHTKIITPPLKELNIMYDLARKGMIDDLIKQVENLEQLEEKYAVFTKQIKNLAQEFAIKKIRIFLKSAIDTS